MCKLGSFVATLNVSNPGTISFTIEKRAILIEKQRCGSNYKANHENTK